MSLAENFWTHCEIVSWVLATKFFFFFISSHISFPQKIYFLRSRLAYLMIHLADPLGVIIIIILSSVRTSFPNYQNLTKQNKFSSGMFTFPSKIFGTGMTVRVAVGIIEDSCLHFVSFSNFSHRGILEVKHWHFPHKIGSLQCYLRVASLVHSADF